MSNINFSEITISIHPLNQVALSIIKIFSNYGLKDVRISKYQSNLNQLYPDINFIKSNDDEMYNCDLYIHTSYTRFFEISNKLINYKCQHVISFVKGLYIFNYTYLPYFKNNVYNNHDVIIKFNIDSNKILATLDDFRNIYNIGDKVIIKPENKKLIIESKDENDLLLTHENELSKFMKLHYIMPYNDIMEHKSIEDCIFNRLYDLDSVNANDLYDLIEYAKKNSEKRVVNHLAYLNTLCAYKCLDSIRTEYNNLNYNNNQIWLYRSNKINNNIEKNILGNITDLNYNPIKLDKKLDLNHIINITNNCDNQNKVELYSLINKVPILNVEFEENQCNLDWIIPDKTSFLSKNTIKSKKDYKECVIQSPYHYEHCIVWAINTLSCIDVDMYYDTDNIVEIVTYVMRIIYYLYEKTITDLQQAHNHNEINDKGALYWKFPRKYPEKLVYHDIPIGFIKILVTYVSNRDYTIDQLKDVINNIPENQIRDYNKNDIELFTTNKQNINKTKNRDLIYTMSSFRCINFGIPLNNSHSHIMQFIEDNNYVSDFIRLRGIIGAYNEIDNYEKNGIYNNHIISLKDESYEPCGPKINKSIEMDPVMMCPVISIPDGHSEWDVNILKNIDINGIIDLIKNKYGKIFISDIYACNKQLYSNSTEMMYTDIEQFAEENHIEHDLELVIIANDEDYNIVQLPNFIYIIE